MRTRTIMLQAQTSQLLSRRAHPGHGDDRGELLQAILVVTVAVPMHAQQTPVHREAQSERVVAPQQGRPLVHVLTENSGEQMLCKSTRGMAILILFPLARMDGVS